MNTRIGHDLVDIDRFERIVAKHPDRWRKRVFTDHEWERAQGRPHPYASLAVRFAAKEAVMKALRTGWGKGVGWRDIEVRGGGRAAPTLALHGRAKEVADQARLRFDVSLSHTSQLASASVLAYQQ